MRARAIAFHLPQFHPIPENDEWWGPGFTEWTNVAAGRPLFRGHEQPILPGELGFYDLRLPETQEAQAALSAQYGVEGFAYWHYWFAGRRLLERPVEALLASSIQQPFCLAWANQTWTGVWHGAPNRVLIEQTYPGDTDERAHFEYVLPAFQDARYITVDGKPVFYVFRPEQLPDAAHWTGLWRRMAAEAGLPGLYLIAEVSDLLGRGPVFQDVTRAGFDAGVYVRIPARTQPMDTLRMRARRKLRGGPEVFPHAADLPAPPEALRHEPLLPCIYPNWDNTPRSSRRGVVVHGSSPAAFGHHVRQGVDRLDAAGLRGDARLLFVKSWNEWAEGNHIEPDRVHGRAWLDALKRGLSEADD